MYIQGSYDDFDFDPSNAWQYKLVITLFQAVIKGIPLTGRKFRYVANKNLSSIEDPKYFQREDWFNNYVWTEYTLDEISSGVAFNRLTSKL